MGWDDMGPVISAGESNLKYRKFNVGEAKASHYEGKQLVP
jgi:hypothetical protein